MERTLFAPPTEPAPLAAPKEARGDEVNASALYAQNAVNPAQLAENVRRVLQSEQQCSLARVIERFPLQKGVAELVGYMQLAAGDKSALIHEEVEELVPLEIGGKAPRRVRMPQVIFGKVSA